MWGCPGTQDARKGGKVKWWIKTCRVFFWWWRLGIRHLSIPRYKLGAPPRSTNSGVCEGLVRGPFIKMNRLYISWLVSGGYPQGIITFAWRFLRKENIYITTLKRNHLVVSIFTWLLLGFQTDPVRTNPTRQFLGERYGVSAGFLVQFTMVHRRYEAINSCREWGEWTWDVYIFTATLPLKNLT